MHGSHKLARPPLARRAERKAADPHAVDAPPRLRVDDLGHGSEAQRAALSDAVQQTHTLVSGASAAGGPLQRRRAAGGPDASSAAALDAARAAVAGPGRPLPFHERIQAAFGRHAVDGVRAHTDTRARDASRAIGASAYATGDAVAFDGAPDLFTAAHEAAHIVQQRGGLTFVGGVGRAGDRYEQHADAVAHAVVRGQSAEALLDRFAPRGATGRGGPAGMQRKASPIQRTGNGPEGGSEQAQGTTDAPAKETSPKYAPEGTVIEPAQIPTVFGMPTKNAEAFQAAAEEHGVVIAVRPTNEKSVELLEGGAMPKPEYLKAKSIKPEDFPLGAKEADEGKVGFFEPPSEEELEAKLATLKLSEEEKKKVRARRAERAAEFKELSSKMERLQKDAKHPIYVTPDGVVMDLRTGKPFTGDHDVFSITHPDGTPASPETIAKIVAQLKPYGVEHPPHMNWDVPKDVMSEGIDGTVRATHTKKSEKGGGEGLICFSPGAPPKVGYHHPKEGEADENNRKRDKARQLAKGPAAEEPAPPTKRSEVGDAPATKRSPGEPEAPDTSAGKKPDAAHGAKPSAPARPRVEEDAPPTRPTRSTRRSPAATDEVPATKPSTPEADEAPVAKRSPPADEAPPAKQPTTPDDAPPTRRSPTSSDEAPATKPPAPSDAAPATKPPTSSDEAPPTKRSPTSAEAPATKPVTPAPEEAPPTKRSPSGTDEAPPTKRSATAPAGPQPKPAPTKPPAPVRTTPGPSVQTPPADTQGAKPPAATKPAEAPEAKPAPTPKPAPTTKPAPDEAKVNEPPKAKEPEVPKAGRRVTTDKSGALVDQPGEAGAKKPKNGSTSVDISDLSKGKIDIAYNFNLATIKTTIPILGAAGGANAAGVYLELSASAGLFANGSVEVPPGDAGWSASVKGGIATNAQLAIKGGVQLQAGPVSAEASISAYARADATAGCGVKVTGRGSDWQVAGRETGIEASISASVGVAATLQAGLPGFSVGQTWNIAGPYTLPIVHASYPIEGKPTMALSEEAKGLPGKVAAGVASLAGRIKDSVKQAVDNTVDSITGLDEKRKQEDAERAAGLEANNDGWAQWRAWKDEIGLNPGMVVNDIGRAATQEELDNINDLGASFVKAYEAQREADSSAGAAAGYAATLVASKAGAKVIVDGIRRRVADKKAKDEAARQAKQAADQQARADLMAAQGKLKARVMDLAKAHDTLNYQGGKALARGVSQARLHPHFDPANNAYLPLYNRAQGIATSPSSTVEACRGVMAEVEALITTTRAGADAIKGLS